MATVSAPSTPNAGAKRVLARLTSPDVTVSAQRDVVLLVPVGATEQHGPHLPLATDTDIAGALADLVASRREDAVVAPPVAYGASGEHETFGGTLSIGQAATELLLVELGRSASATFRRIIFVSSHGGNAGAVRRATATLRAEGRDARSFFPDWRGDAHAGRTETSLMLAVAPDRVRLPLAAAGASAPIAELLPRLREGGVASVSPNGVLGDPAGAGADEGRVLLDAAACTLGDSIDRWEEPS